jgi:hypothetical protein
VVSGELRRTFTEEVALAFSLSACCISHRLPAQRTGSAINGHTNSVSEEVLRPHERHFALTQ